MPLIKSPSKKVFSKNVESEMHSGKPQDQSLAIAYSVKRQARKKKMAEGGMVKDEDDKKKTIGEIIGYPGSGAPKPAPKPHYSAGGQVKPQSISEAIRMKAKEKMMADGGMVDLEENAEEQPNQYQDLNIEAAGKELYDDEQLSEQPMDSNEQGDDGLESDLHDMVSQIRARMKRAGRGMMP